MALDDIVAALTGIGAGIGAGVLTANPLIGIAAGYTAAGVTKGAFAAAKSDDDGSFFSRFGKSTLYSMLGWAAAGAIGIPLLAYAAPLGIPLTLGYVAALAGAGGLMGGLLGAIPSTIGGLGYSAGYGISKAAVDGARNSDTPSWIYATLPCLGTAAITTAMFGPLVGIPAGIAAYAGAKGIVDGLRNEDEYTVSSFFGSIGKGLLAGALTGAVIGGIGVPALAALGAGAMPLTLSTAPYLIGGGMVMGGLAGAAFGSLASTTYSIPYGISRAIID